MLLVENTNENSVICKILAALLLLAKGVAVPLKIKKVECRYVVEGKEKSEAISILQYERSEDSFIGPIGVELSLIIDVKKHKRKVRENRVYRKGGTKVQ